MHNGNCRFSISIYPHTCVDLIVLFAPCIWMMISVVWQIEQQVFSCCGIGDRLILPYTIVTPSKHCTWKNVGYTRLHCPPPQPCCVQWRGLMNLTHDRDRTIHKVLYMYSFLMPPPPHAYSSEMWLYITWLASFPGLETKRGMVCTVCACAKYSVTPSVIYYTVNLARHVVMVYMSLSHHTYGVQLEVAPTWTQSLERACF